MDVRLKAVHLLACTGQPDTFEQLRQLAVRDGVREEVKTAILEAMYRLDQEAKRKETETVEAVEADSEPEFETTAPETMADHDGQGFEFSFGPSSQPESHAQVSLEAQPDLDEHES